jgi:hypothetical protein
MWRCCLISLVAISACDKSTSKPAPRPEPSPAEREAIAKVLPGAAVGLPLPLSKVRFGMTHEEARAVAPAALAGELSVVHESPLPGTPDGTIAIRFNGGRVHQISLSLPGKELRSTLEQLWGPPVRTKWWLNPGARVRAELGYSSTVTLAPYFPLRDLLGTGDRLGFEPLVGVAVDEVRTRFAEAYREETAAEMAASAERILRHAPPGVDPADLLRGGPMRNLFLAPTELAGNDHSTVVDLRARDGVVAGFTLTLRYADPSERAELERAFAAAWGSPPPARLRLRDATDDHAWKIVVGSE